MELLRSVFAPITAFLDGVLKAFGIPEILVPLLRNVLLIAVVVIGGKVLWRQQLRQGTSPTEGMSLQDLAVETQSAVADTYRTAIAAAAAQCKARTPGETLCFLAASGDVDTVQYLLEQGVPVDSRDRWGQTPLMNAAGSRQANAVALLLAVGAQTELLDRKGCSALVHAYAAGANSEVIDLLQMRGATVLVPGAEGYPEDGPYAGVLDPPALTADRVPHLQQAYSGLTASHVAGLVAADQPTLLAAIQKIDTDEQLNEPEIQQRALRDRDAMELLLLNAALGNRLQSPTLYWRDLWRHHELPKAIMDQATRVRALRKAQPEYLDRDNQLVQTAEVAAATRRLNALILQHLIGGWVELGLGDLVPEGGGEAALIPTIPPNAPAWVTKPLQRYDYEGRSVDEIQDMINEIYAAAGMFWPGAGRMNEHYRSLGYVQVSKDPPLTAAQQANVNLLAARRSELQAAKSDPLEGMRPPSSGTGCLDSAADEY